MKWQIGNNLLTKTNIQAKENSEIDNVLRLDKNNKQG